MKQPSASNAESFVMCGASHVLPQSSKHNDFMYRGTEGHEPLANRLNGKVPGGTERGLEFVKDFPLDKVMAGVTKWRGEAAFAVNVKTRSSRLIGINVGREYGKLEKYEIPCTLDADGMKADRAFVRDWKFGVSSNWWQLLIQCMAVAYDDPENPLSEVDAGFVFIDGETRGAEYREDSRIVSLEEIDDAADKMVAAWDRVESMDRAYANGDDVDPMTTEGSWCQYCGAFPHCPSKWNIARAIGSMAPTPVAILSAMTQEEQGQLWAILRERKKMIEDTMDVLKASAAVQPLPLPNGKQLVMLRMKGGERVDKKEALRVLKELGASDDDYAAVIKKSADYQQAKEIKR